MRRNGVIVGAALVLAWIAMLRFGMQLFIASPLIGRLGVLATVGVSCLMENRLAAVSLAELNTRNEKVSVISKDS